MEWKIVENMIGECIPNCIKIILTECAYTSLLSLKSISAKSVVEIEEHVNLYCRDLIQNLTCSHNECPCEGYKHRDKFQLLPGHRDLIVAIAKTINEQQLSEHENEYERFAKAIDNHSSFSVILKELLKTALRNGKRSKNNFEYSEIIQYFASYVFILCGRACYTVLSKNLPLPSISSIRTFQFSPNVFLICMTFRF